MAVPGWRSACVPAQYDRFKAALGVLYIDEMMLLLECFYSTRAQHGEIENPSYTPLKLQVPSTPFRRTYCTQDFGCMYTGGQLATTCPRANSALGTPPTVQISGHTA